VIREIQEIEVYLEIKANQVYQDSRDKMVTTVSKVSRA